MLTTFQIVCNEKVISPRLVTTREYGDWLENTYDNYTSQKELYLKAHKRDGETVLERHSGTRIGTWFNKNSVKFKDKAYKSWFILQESPVMKKLAALHLAEMRDAIPISINDEDHRNMIRVYTLEQIELYIRSNLDRSFRVSDYVGVAKQVRVKKSDLNTLIIPETHGSRNRLF